MFRTTSLTCTFLATALLTGCGQAPKKSDAPAATPAASGIVLKAPKGAQAPAIDGSAEALWDALPATELTAVHENEKRAVTLKAFHDGTTFYLLATWPDADENSEHRPWIWNDAESKYVAGKEREDRIAIEFAMSKTFDECMLGGTPYVADCWHWKACRSNPASAVDEEWHKASQEPFAVDGKNAPDYPDKSGAATKKPTLYMMRVKDKGKAAFKSVSAPTAKGEAKIAAVAYETPDGGQADVKAKGVWKDGRWTVEFSRPLKSSNATEDVEFQPGQPIPFAMAVFDKVGDSNHQTTPRGTLELGQ